MSPDALASYPDVVIVTGAGGGIGSAVVELLAARGVSVAAADLEAPDQLATDGSDGGGSVRTFALDVTSAKSWSTLCEAVAASETTYGLVNVAGVMARTGLLDTDDTTWSQLLDVNLTGVFLGMRSVVGALMASRPGVVVNIGSVAGRVGHYSVAYSASKWGVRGLTKAAAGELAGQGIRVNSVHPGVVTTPLVSGADSLVRSLVAQTPAGRPASAFEVARAVAFLLSSDASYITGEDLTVDGGFVSAGAYRRIWAESNA